MTTFPITSLALPQRLWKVVRINLVRPWKAFFLPLIIMTVIVSMASLLSWLTVAFVSADGQIWFSPEIFLVILLFVAANQTTYHDFPISLSYGITRNDFYFGTLATFAILSVWYAIVAISIAAVSNTFFLMELGVGVIEFLGLIVLFLGTQVLASSITTIYLRWGKPGMVTFFGLIALMIIALPVLAINDAGSSPAVLNSEALELMQANAIAGGITLALAALGYLVIRRARVG